MYKDQMRQYLPLVYVKSNKPRQILKSEQGNLFLSLDVLNRDECIQILEQKIFNSHCETKLGKQN